MDKQIELPTLEETAIMVFDLQLALRRALAENQKLKEENKKLREQINEN